MTKAEARASTSHNGKMTEQTAKRYLPTLLTPRDMQRAKARLADVLGDRSPYEVLEDDVDRVPFTIWCLESRADPEFTWDQALDTPYLGEFRGGDSRPPPTDAPSGSLANASASVSRSRPTATGAAPASAPSSG